MDPQQDDWRRQRENMLVLIFCTVGGMFLFAFLMVITAGFFIYFVGVILLLCLLGFVNYALWGRDMNRETEGEREEAQVKMEAELNEWDRPVTERRFHE
jgi:high-affinity Fe2+/Pb2+ permease